MKPYARFLRGVLLLIVAAGITGCMSFHEGEEVPPPTPFEQQPLVYPVSTINPVSSIIGDGGLLSKQPCGPPCFFGIVPGQTHYTEAENILVNQGLINYCTVIDEYAFAQEEGIGGWWCDGFAVEFDRATGIVNHIQFALSPPIQLRTIVDRYGSPDAVSVINMGGEHTPLLGGEVRYFQYHMVLFSDTEQQSWEYKFAPTMFIDGVIYEDETGFMERLEGFEPEMWLWHGYGTYSVP